MGLILLLIDSIIDDRRTTPFHIVPITIPTQDYDGKAPPLPDKIPPEESQ